MADPAGRGRPIRKWRRSSTRARRSSSRTTLEDEQDGPNWRNVTVVRDIDKKDVKKLKKEVDGNLTILGSGAIVQQLSNLRLIDE